MKLKHLAWLSVVWLIALTGSAVAETSITATKTISVTPTIDTNIYASGDALGGLQTLTGAGRIGIGTGIIHSVLIADLDSEAADIDLWIFSSNPSGSTITNNVAQTIVDADLVKVVCVIQVTTDSAAVTNGVSFAAGNNCVFQADAATGTLYVVPIVRGTPTYTSASDLTFRYSILQD